MVFLRTDSFKISQRQYIICDCVSVFFFLRNCVTITAKYLYLILKYTASTKAFLCAYRTPLDCCRYTFTCIKLIVTKARKICRIVSYKLAFICFTKNNQKSLFSAPVMVAYLLKLNSILWLKFLKSCNTRPKKLNYIPDFHDVAINMKTAIRHANWCTTVLVAVYIIETSCVKITQVCYLTQRF